MNSNLFAGFLLSQQAFYCSSLVEKESYDSNYELAILLLELLIRGNHAPHKNGKVYIRLAVDYNHLRCHDLAEDILKRAISDKYVKVLSSFVME